MIFILLYRDMAMSDSNASTIHHNDFNVSMQRELPPYVMKCLLLSGYDEKDVIQTMHGYHRE